MRKITTISILLVLLFISCNNHVAEKAIDKSVIKINIDNMEVGRQFDFYELFDNFERILNKDGTQKSSGSWTIGIAYNGTDMYQLKDLLHGNISIHKFENDEKVCDIGKIGSKINSGEYSDKNKLVNDFENDRIYILSMEYSRILKYNFSGKYLGYISVKNEKTSMPCEQFTITPDGDAFMIYYKWGNVDNSTYNFAIIDTIGKMIDTVKTYQKLNNNYPAFKTGCRFYIHNNQLHVYDIGGTVFRIEENKFIPKYVFSSRYALDDINHSKIALVISENNDYLFFTINDLQNKFSMRYYCYMDKNTGKTYKFSEPNTSYTVLPDSGKLRIFSLPDKKLCYKSYDGKLYKLIRKD